MTLPRTCCRDPRKHITLDRSNAKLVRQRSHPMTLAYGIDHFSAKRKARRLNVIVDAGPKPPEAEKISGVKDDISTSLTRCSYCRLLTSSWRRYTAVVVEVGAFECARGLKILTSKNAHSRPPPHRPLALTSRRASGSRLPLARSSCSPLRGCNFGSISTS